MGWVTQGTTTAYYSQKSWAEYRPWGFKGSNSIPTKNDVDLLMNQSVDPKILLYQDSQYYSSTVLEYEDYVKVVAHLKVDSYSSLLNYLEEIGTLELSGSSERIITTSITFNRLLTSEELENLIATYNLDVQAFRFEGDRNGREISGMCLPLEGTTIPIEQLKQFLNPAEFKGFYRIDVKMKASQIENLRELSNVLYLDLNGQLALDATGIHEKPVTFIFNDPFWLLT